MTWLQSLAAVAGMIVLAAACLIVLLAPLALSFHSLAGWGRNQLGLTGYWPYVVPLALDACAVACVGLAFYASSRGESAGASRLLVLVVAGASAAANWRHGIQESVDAAVFHAAMPVSAAVLLELVLGLVKRRVRGDKGALERALPRYRLVRWMIAPRETWQAWAWAVREGVTDPLAALDASRRAHGSPRASIIQPEPDPAEPLPAAPRPLAAAEPTPKPAKPKPLELSGNGPKLSRVEELLPLAREVAAGHSGRLSRRALAEGLEARGETAGTGTLVKLLALLNPNPNNSNSNSSNGDGGGSG